jgi:hypothetical protein
MIGEKFIFAPVLSWVESLAESTRDVAARTRTASTFVLLPELEDSLRLILDRIYRNQGRGFLVAGLYGSGKTIYMAYLSALLAEQTLRKSLLDQKPEWGLDALVNRRFLTINFNAIGDQDLSLEEAFWRAISQELRALTPPVTETFSNTDAYLDLIAALAEGIKGDLESYISATYNVSPAQLASYDKAYQKDLWEKALSAKGIQLDDRRTTIAEKIRKFVQIAHSRGFDGVAVFMDELYLHLIQSDANFNRGTNFLTQLGEAALGENTPFWVFGAVQEEIQALARQAGRNYDTELTGRLAGQSGRFQYVNLPVTQFHRIYNHRLFRANTNRVNQLADCFRSQIQPHYRGSFAEFFRRYFRDKTPVTDEAVHFADLYPMHPLALLSLTRITNVGGRSRGALGFVQDFIEKYKDSRPWQQIAVLDDVFEYPDLRNKIIQDAPEIGKYYTLFDKFCSNARDQVLSRAPYRAFAPEDKNFVKLASERVVRALIILAVVKEELDVAHLNDALLLRWPGKESDPAGSDEETRRLLEKIEAAFPALRSKGPADARTFFISIESDGGEREELQTEIGTVINGFNADLQKEPAYRAHLQLFLSFPGSPLGGSIAPQRGFASEVSFEWQRTLRRLDYRLETTAAMTQDLGVTSFIREVPQTKSAHLLMLLPSASPLDVELDKVKKGAARTLVWLPETLTAKDTDELRHSMALVKLYGDYRAMIEAGGASQSVRRKLELLHEYLGLPAESAAPQPSQQAIKILCDTFVNGRIARWDGKDQAWSTLHDKAKVLGDFNSIPGANRSLPTLLQRLLPAALDLFFPLHPDFQSAYTFSADLAAVTRKRLLEGIWKARVTDDDGPLKDALEKYLSPLSLLDAAVAGELSIILGTACPEGFKKVRDRIRDRIRKSNTDPKEVPAPAVREDLRTSDFGFTDLWADISITVLLTLGEITAMAEDGKTVSSEDKSGGSPVDWLPRITKLRAGAKPDDTLWKDLINSLQVLGRWLSGTNYSPAAAERLLACLCQAETDAQTQLTQAQAALQSWAGPLYLRQSPSRRTSSSSPPGSVKTGRPVLLPCVMLCATFSGWQRTTWLIPLTATLVSRNGRLRSLRPKTSWSE